MTFKEFVEWMNQRACDGQWGMTLAMDCMAVYESIRKEPFWRRKRAWKTICEDRKGIDLLKRISKTDAMRKTIKQEARHD